MAKYLFLDLILVLSVLLLHWRRLNFFHPLTIYIFFHLYSFTWRALEITLGAPTLYSIGYNSAVEPVTIDEIIRALIYADLGLFAFSLGASAAGRDVDKKLRGGGLGLYKELVPRYVWGIVAPCIFIGAVVGYMIRSGQADFSAFGLGSYLGVTSMWPITALVMIYFITGTFWPISPFVLVYLGVASLQGYHRFMTVLPILSLINVYIIHHKRKWPPVAAVALLGGLLLTFPYMKGIGRSFSAGDYNDATSQFKTAFDISAKTDFTVSNDGFLDQFAGYLTLCDRYGKYEFGSTYLSLVTLPIPRSVWPSKPTLGEHISKRSAEDRPYAKEGRIITHLGESYVNFGLPGIFFISLFIGYALCYATEKSHHLPVLSLEVLFQVFLTPSLIQAYRDGLVSLVLFGIVFNMPLIFLWFSHMRVPKKHSFPSHAGR